MKVYISGKMGGLAREEYEPLFRQAEDQLRREGYDVVNPCDWVEAFIKAGWDWGRIIIYELDNLLSGCHAIYMLRNWQDDSCGAMVEYWFAKGKGLEVMYECPPRDVLGQTVEGSWCNQVEKLTIAKKMKKYRLKRNMGSPGKPWYIQRRCRFLWWSWWETCWIGQISYETPADAYWALLDHLTEDYYIDVDGGVVGYLKEDEVEHDGTDAE